MLAIILVTESSIARATDCEASALTYQDRIILTNSFKRNRRRAWDTVGVTWQTYLAQKRIPQVLFLLEHEFVYSGRMLDPSKRGRCGCIRAGWNSISDHLDPRTTHFNDMAPTEGPEGQ